MGSLDATISKVFVGDDGIYVFKIQMCSRIDLGEAHMSNDWCFKALVSTVDDTGGLHLAVLFHGVKALGSTLWFCLDMSAS
jgi:hypothetical protein